MPEMVNYRLAFQKMRRPMAAEHPTDAGDADCHVASLLAMTVVFDHFRTKTGANRNEKYVIANQSADWCGNPFSCDAKHHVGHRPTILLK